MTEQYATRIEDIGIHSAGWVRLPSGVEITAMPLLDTSGRGPLFCRGSETARRWLAERGWRLPTADEYRELHKLCGKDGPGVHITPTTIYVDASNSHLMATKAWCTRHDVEVMQKLEAIGWDGKAPVDNAGKHIDIDGDIIGWEKRDGDPESAWIQPESSAHRGHQQLDYATTVHAVRDSAADTDRNPAKSASWSDGLDLDAMTLGERCIAWMGFQWGRGIKAIPGPQHDPRILEYSRHARRGGEFLGVDEDGKPKWKWGAPLPAPSDEWAWCSYGASCSLLFALRPGERPPHGLRAAVAELVADARKSGAWRDVGWTPKPGSRAIYGRNGQDPRHGGEGHVRAVVAVLGKMYRGLGANENGTWSFGDYRRDGADAGPGRKLVGWIDVDHFSASDDGDDAPRSDESGLVEGIDLSHHQSPAVMPWDRIARDFRFAYVRAAYGISPDKHFVEHVRRCRAAGLAVGAYTFIRQTQGAAAQMATLVQQMEAAQMGSNDLAPALDLESNAANGDGPISTTLALCGEAMADACVKRWGVKPMVYTERDAWKQMGSPQWVLDCGVWTSWPSMYGDDPWPSGKWTVWQHHHGKGAAYPASLDQNRARLSALPRLP